MIAIPKPKFFERKVPTGQSEDDYFDEIIARQTHMGRYENGELFSRSLQKSLELYQNGEQLSQKFAILINGQRSPELSKWRTFVGRSYQNGELFDSDCSFRNSSCMKLHSSVFVITVR